MHLATHLDMNKLIYDVKCLSPGIHTYLKHSTDLVKKLLIGGYTATADESITVPESSKLKFLIRVVRVWKRVLIRQDEYAEKFRDFFQHSEAYSRSFFL